MNYDYGNKAQWRRHVWNRIAERAHDRTGLVLFLAGRDALDVEVAARKGFRPGNMIAIERDASTLKTLRDSGQLAVDGDFFETLASWPNDRAVSVVVADLCCGLTQSVVRGMVQAFQHPAFQKTVFLLNLLRGRDVYAVQARELAAQVSPESYSDDGDEKHRGIAFVALLAATISHQAATHERSKEDGDRLYEFARAELMNKMNPAFYSYRSTSGTQRFDTVIFRHPFAEDSVPAPSWKSEDYSVVQRRRISATLAHHTIRARAGARK